jgi:1-acyl-sn-glycerol-3-phosphate acyltransferase
MDSVLRTIGLITAVVSGVVVDAIGYRAIDTKNERTFRRVRYTGLENLGPRRGRIIISNHSCFLDFAIIRRIVDCYCVANIASFIRINNTDADLFMKYKIISYDYTTDGGESVKRKILELVNAGEDVLVFPEGYAARLSSRTESLLKPFKPGLFHLAYDNGIPVLPISQWHHNNNDNSYFDSNLQNVVFGTPIDNLDVDVIISGTVHPRDYENFGEFHRACSVVVEENLKLFRV